VVVKWERPVPLVGDVTSASQRAADPTGWAFPDAERHALYAVIAARRDVRRFRPDGIDDAILRRVLAAAHSAPSVGHSQPWRFIVVRDQALRTRAGLLADRERLRQAGLLAPDAARRLLDLQLEGVREAPVGVVVCCDRRTPAAGVLGRATFADADMWSCAAAIQNLWLAARAEGLGLGWVTLFRPDELAALVGLPDGVETLGWLCLGWPDERPPDPGLERAGWSKRLPLDSVVFTDGWPRGEAPAAPPSHLRAPGPADVVAAHDDSDRLLTPPGSLGVLDRAVERVLAARGPDIHTGTLILAAADHPVTGLGVSAFPPSVTAQVFAAAAAGTALGVAAARAAGFAVHLVDAGIDRAALAAARHPTGVGGTTVVAPGHQPAGADHPTGVGATDEAAGADPAGPPVEVTTLTLAADRGDLASTDAMSRVDAERFVAMGSALGREAAGRGLVALGEIGIGNTTVAACLAAALTGMDVDEAVGLGAGADSAILDRKRAVVGAAVDRWRSAPGHADPMSTLAALGGPEIAVLAGVILGAAEAGTVVVLDGLATGVAALVALALEPAVAAHLVAGQRSRERGHARVLTDLGAEALLDLRIRAGEGVGACLAAGLLLDALAMRRTAARVAS
jgi:nicotinate-nucleotide--dimethylbenzimidazole phosphoribosyltransferase